MRKQPGLRIRGSMTGQSIKKIRKNITLLLCCAIMAHPATAFAFEEGTSDVSVSGDVLSLNAISENAISENAISDNALSDNALSDNSPAEDTEAEEADGSHYAEEGASGNAVSVNSLSEDAVSGGKLPDDSVTGYSDEEIESLNELLSSKTVRGVVFNCESCDLKSSPSASAKTAVKLPCASSVLLKKAVYDGSKLWFEVTCYVSDREYSGFIERDSFVCTDDGFNGWENRSYKAEGGNAVIMAGGEDYAESLIKNQALMSVDDFPESYRDKLYALLASHPNWVFVPQKHSVTSLDTAVNGEYSDRNRNWVYKNAIDSFKEGAADSSGNWYYASKSCIRYYMNPLNFLDESHVFQFEQLGYNASYHTQDGVQSILNGTFMSGAIPDDTRTYAQAFMEIGKNLSMSPYHLASRVRLEQGSAGSSQLISGTYKGFEGYYNYFNLKASGSTAEEVITNGLTYAKSQGWNTRYKSLNGGAAFLGNGYISVGQDTGYLEKYDLIEPLYTHQYMQNVQAPSTEAVSTYSQYKSAGTINNAFVFKIPVFYDAGNPEGVPADSVVTEKPYVKVTQISKPNLFFTGDAAAAYAKFKLTSNYPITGVSDLDKTKEAAGSKPYFSVESYDNGLLTLKTVNRTAANSKTTYKRYYFSVSLDGEDPVNVTVNVGASFVKPVIRAEQALFIEGFDTAYAVLTDNKKNAVSLPDDTSLTCSDTALKCVLDTDGSRIEMTKNANFKAGSRKMVLSSSLWTSDITFSASVKNAGKPSFKLLKSSAVLNSNVLMEKYGTLDIKVIRNEAYKMETDAVIKAGDKKTEELLGSYIHAGYSDGILSLAVLKEGLKTGSYRLILTPSYKGPDGVMYPLNDLRFTIKVTDKDPAAALVLRKSGRINTVDREDGGFMITPVTLNTGSGTVSAAVIDPSDTDNTARFEAQLLNKGDITPCGKTVTSSEGIIYIKAKEGADLSTALNYEPVLMMTMENGLIIKKSVKIRPMQKRAALYANIRRAVMMRSSSVSRNYVICSKGITPDDSVIESVELYRQKGGEYFDFTGSSSSNGSLRKYYGVLKLKDTSIKNGTYTLRFLVKLKGHASNITAYTVTTTIRIK